MDPPLLASRLGRMNSLSPIFITPQPFRFPLYTSRSNEFSPYKRTPVLQPLNSSLSPFSRLISMNTPPIQAPIFCNAPPQLLKSFFLYSPLRLISMNSPPMKASLFYNPTSLPSPPMPPFPLHVLEQPPTPSTLSLPPNLPSPLRFIALNSTPIKALLFYNHRFPPFFPLNHPPPPRRPLHVSEQ